MLGIKTTIYDDVRAFAEQILVDRIFMGDYVEKRYVDKLNAYKDLIAMNKQEEILASDLAKVENRILGVNRNAWFGYTEPHDVGAPPVNCIWTNLDEPDKTTQGAASVVFGEYWFQIKGIRFGANAVEIHIKVLRPIDSTSSMSNSMTISSFAQQAMEIDSTKIQQYVQENIVEVDWVALFNQWKISINRMVYRFFSTEITWNNFVHCIQLFGLLCISFAKLSVNFIHSTGEFTLRLIFELRKLIQTASPIVLSMLSLLTKMIGGFYILIAMIWKDLFYGDSNSNRKNGQVPNHGHAPIAYREYTNQSRPQYSFRRPNNSTPRYNPNM